MATLKVPGLRKPLPLESIVWIEANDNYARVHFSNRGKHLAAQTLKCFADQLPSFIRVSKSSLINPQHLLLFEKQNYRQAKVTLSNGVKLVVSRRRVVVIIDQLETKP